jgi:pyruvate dehydrogenase E1 component
LLPTPPYYRARPPPHPTIHSWLGAIRGQRIIPLGPDRFGQAGDIPHLYRE